MTCYRTRHRRQVAVDASVTWLSCALVCLMLPGVFSVSQNAMPRQPSHSATMEPDQEQFLIPLALVAVSGWVVAFLVLMMSGVPRVAARAIPETPSAPCAPSESPTCPADGARHKPVGLLIFCCR